MGARVVGIGTALPEKVITNHDLAAMMDTSDEWIRERTGVRERRIGLPTSTLGIQAGRAAMDMAGAEPDDIDLFVLATTTPDQRVPGTSAVIQAELGLSCGAFDLNAACAGFTYGFVVANSMLDRPGGPQRMLLIGADSLSPLTDWTDRGTAILFADGGGAVVLEHIDATTLPRLGPRRRRALSPHPARRPRLDHHHGGPRGVQGGGAGRHPVGEGRIGPGPGNPR